MLVAAIIGNIIDVGDPSMVSYDATRFGARARTVEPCKGCVKACFGLYNFAHFRAMIQVSEPHMSHDQIYAANISVVRINGKVLRLGHPINSPYDAL